MYDSGQEASSMVGHCLHREPNMSTQHIHRGLSAALSVYQHMPNLTRHRMRSEPTVESSSLAPDLTHSRLREEDHSGCYLLVAYYAEDTHRAVDLTRKGYPTVSTCRDHHNRLLRAAVLSLSGLYHGTTVVCIPHGRSPGPTRLPSFEDPLLRLFVLGDGA